MSANERKIMRTLSDLQGAVVQNSNLLHELLTLHRNQVQTNNSPSVIDMLAAKVEETNEAMAAIIATYNNPTKYAEGAGSSAGGAGAGAQGTIAQGSGSA